MSELKVIAAAKNGDVEAVDSLLASGKDVNEQDEHGWTPLCWAAGEGNTEMVEALLKHGADVTRTGRDLRTPLMIAKAASRESVVAILTEAEKEKGVWEDPRLNRPYCKAYYLKDLRRYPGWSEREAASDAAKASEDRGEGEQADEAAALDDESIVYIHQDFTVTRSMWHGEDVVFDEVVPEWQQFCTDQLDFAIPDDLL